MKPRANRQKTVLEQMRPQGMRDLGQRNPPPRATDKRRQVSATKAIRFLLAARTEEPVPNGGALGITVQRTNDRRCGSLDAIQRFR
jgi:hypothetical protein